MGGDPAAVQVHRGRDRTGGQGREVLQVRADREGAAVNVGDDCRAVSLGPRRRGHGGRARRVGRGRSDLGGDPAAVQVHRGRAVSIGPRRRGNARRAGRGPPGLGGDLAAVQVHRAAGGGQRSVVATDAGNRCGLGASRR
jgi:hypothetical protein